MIDCIGIRMETKDETERRVPLSPDQVGQLVRDNDIRVLVEPMQSRVFSDAEYRAAGAEVTPDLSDANIVFGIKEIAPQYMIDGMAYMFFSHTIKAQPYNMPMLRHIIERGITLLDHELVKDESGRRLVFFGNFAGLAGMIDSLWAMGRRMLHEGIDSPFARVRYATEYALLDRAEAALREVGEEIRRNGLPREMTPFITGFAGYGNVSKGAQHMYDMLPVESIAPDELDEFMRRGEYSNRIVYKVEFREEDMFESVNDSASFQLQDFYEHPGNYRSKFERYIPHLSMLVNGIYWDARYPRLVTKEYARRLFSGDETPRLRVIGDITCDIDGSVQLNVKESNSLNPVYVYEPLTGAVRDGWEGDGPVILAVDKLPTELPREASCAFGESLLPFVPILAHAELSVPFDAVELPPELKHSIIVHRGELTPDYEYLAAAAGNKQGGVAE